MDHRTFGDWCCIRWHQHPDPRRRQVRTHFTQKGVTITTPRTPSLQTLIGRILAAAIVEVLKGKK